MLQFNSRVRHLITILAAGAGCLAASCVIIADGSDGDDGPKGHNKHMHAGNSHGAHGPTALAKIEGRSDCGLSGTATFVEMKGGVLVTIEVNDAPPGWHAVHVHQKGDCSSDDGKSAGGHFNPDSTAHGSPHASEHHAGDLGNMWVNESGVGHHVILMHDLTVAAGDSSVVGRGIIVHAGADDLVSQPTGAAGGRIGCGEIGAH